MSTGWNNARRILCVRLDNMGDVLMTTPALRALKGDDSHRHLTLLTSSVGTALDRHLPMVDQVWGYDAPWVKHPNASSNAAPDFAMIERLAAGRFDAAVIFTVYSQSPLPAAMMCWLAGIPLRLAHCRENPYRLLTDRVVETEPHQRVRHEVVRQLELVHSIGATTTNWQMEFACSEQDQRSLQRRLQATLRRQGAPFVQPGLGRWLVVHPGASAPSRRWPAERFGEVAAQLAPQFDAVAVTGSAAESELVDAVCARAGKRAVPLAGRLSLGEMGALVGAADVLITNNSGPAHLAAAVGTPVVDLYALTNPQHTPWRVPHRVLSADVPCKYCYRSECSEPGHPCLTGVGVDEVVAAARSLLDGHDAAHAERWATRRWQLGSPSPANVIPIATAIARA
ncbi:glycosyltransferase family 9 protein [Mycetohabitans sp. B5]|uniref:Lipopolysaccharide heptosyltransferase II n=1 Tax=Mycetohabitans endofungorum TaxID=417203 RepID=A0A2P5K8G9_9BURK|nr:MULTISPECIES: glycosyltransferase family 9 protein [Mycetohabitans]MCG1053587.1 glycosyltransferase family 9 protein [Mycetohabitans sp. B5]PPB83017.1 lipopolysaccharide heptosyltransferase II [Mycetohabitans endofungorum]